MANAKSRDERRDASDATASKEAPPNPVWFKPIMFGFMLLGLAWLLVFYISSGVYPIADLGNTNIWIGIGIMLIGFLMTTRWR